MTRRYKLTLSPPDDTDPPTNPVWTVDDQIGINPPAVSAPQLISVWDFMSQAQIDDVVARTCTLDCSSAIQSGIDYVSGNAGRMPLGILFFPAGTYRIETTLVANGAITLMGAGQGRTNPPSPAATSIQWYGGANPMLIFGRNGAGVPICGGGVERMQWNGRDLASYCWKFIDASQVRVEDCDLANATTAAWLCTNTPSQTNPSAFWVVSNVTIFQRSGAFPFSAGLYINTPAPGVGSAGVTLCLWDQIDIQHADGPGVWFNGGDNHQWNRLYCFRAQSETGPGVWFSGDGSPGYTEGGNMFFNPVCSGGIRVDYPGNQNDAIYVINFDDGDQYPGIPPLYGNGINRVTMDTHSGRVFGQHKTLGYRESIMHDSMHFVAYNSPVLNTFNGNWHCVADSVVDAAQIGGAVAISTAASPNDIATLSDSATFGSSGVSTAYSPHIIIQAAPLEVSNTIHRWGLMDSATDPPTNGIYVEINPLVDTQNWRAICRSAGSTTVLTPIAPVAYGPGQNISWRIEVQAGVASFYRYTTATAPDYVQFYTYVGSITTNVPATNIKLNTAIQVVGNISVPSPPSPEARTVWVFDVKRGFNTEI